MLMQERKAPVNSIPNAMPTTLLWTTPSTGVGAVLGGQVEGVGGGCVGGGWVGVADEQVGVTVTIVVVGGRVDMVGVGRTDSLGETVMYTVVVEVTVLVTFSQSSELFRENRYGVTNTPEAISTSNGTRPSTVLFKMVSYASLAVIRLVTFATEVKFEISSETTKVLLIFTICGNNRK